MTSVNKYSNRAARHTIERLAFVAPAKAILCGSAATRRLLNENSDAILRTLTTYLKRQHVNVVAVDDIGLRKRLHLFDRSPCVSIAHIVIEQRFETETIEDEEYGLPDSFITEHPFKVKLIPSYMNDLCIIHLVREPRPANPDGECAVFWATYGRRRVSILQDVKAYNVPVELESRFDCRFPAPEGF